MSSHLPLTGLTALQSLNLSQTQVADIAPLAGLNGLGELDLTGTRVPASQATKLRFPFAGRDVKLGVTSP